LHPSTARVSIQHFIPKILASSASNLLAQSSPSKSIGFYLNDDQSSSYLDGGADQYDSAAIKSYESKVYAISNEGGQVKYHVNGGGSGGLSSSTSQQQTKTTPTDPNKQLLLTTTQVDQSGAVAKAQKLNVELPLSILNAASLGAGGISLRINPFLAKGGAGQHEAGGIDGGEELSEAEMNEAAKNARLLENYKAIKVGQMQKEKEKQQQQLLRY
jgi:hypothetical protein